MPFKKLGDQVSHELSEAGINPRQWLKVGLLGLGSLTLVLATIFIVLPLLLSGRQPSQYPKTLPLVYELENISDEDWHGIIFRLDGVSPGEDTQEPNRLNANDASGQDGSFIEYPMGDLAHGEARAIVVYITAKKPGEYEYRSVFTRDDGVVVRLEETRNLQF